ncbi:hypothetical protein FANTH_14289 [Fusarium anthophilum]|uniref:Uncharacterized protein n=1 Tax=Fusarium anthophilum TaxID=48485 RepID=A0A8H4YJU2_9HYPO|nr:hypothetical protein FANTH_14289 [Fusarium anthophilum]
MAEAQDHPITKPLIDRYGKHVFRVVVKRLWMKERFGSGYTAQNLDWEIPAPNAETEYTSEKPAEDTPEKSDWEVLVSADVPEKASPCVLEEEGPMEEATMKEAPAEYESSPEGELPTAKVYPVEEHDEDLPAKASPTEAEKDNCIQEQKAIYLPFSSQHRTMAVLQEVLEGACFAYGQGKLSELLREHGWNCVEAVSLRTWMSHLASIQHISDTVHSEDLWESVAGIQDTAVNRTPIDSNVLRKFLDDAVKLTEILEMKNHGNIVRAIQLDIGKTIEGLSRGEQEAEDQQEKKIKLIAEERRRLAEREADARKDQEKNKRECQKSAELEVNALLEEAKKSLETTTFFSQLAM